MIAVDTSVLVRAHRRDTDQHPAAAAAVAGLVQGTARWAIPWPCVHEFLSVVTRPRYFDEPSSSALAFDQLDAWIGAPSLSLIGEGPAHRFQLRDLVERGAVRGAMVHDAKIAAICLAHGVSELWAADKDFGRFPKLRTRNPLV